MINGEIFKRNFRLSNIDDEQIPKAALLAQDISQKITSPDMTAHFEAEIPIALMQMSTNESVVATKIELARIRAADLLDSMNNILKTLAISALLAKSKADQIASSAIAPFMSNFSRAFAAQFAQEGTESGKRLAVWTGRVLVGLVTSSVAGLGATFLSFISTSFPHYFSWLAPVITFLGTVGLSRRKK